MPSSFCKFLFAATLLTMRVTGRRGPSRPTSSRSAPDPWASPPPLRPQWSNRSSRPLNPWCSLWWPTPAGDRTQTWWPGSSPSSPPSSRTPSPAAWPPNKTTWPTTPPLLLTLSPLCHHQFYIQTLPNIPLLKYSFTASTTECSFMGKHEKLHCQLVV